MRPLIEWTTVDEVEKQRLLQACREAQEAYLKTCKELKALQEQAKAERTAVFKKALSTPLTAREIAEAVGLSGSQIAQIGAGRR